MLFTYFEHETGNPFHNQENPETRENASVKRVHRKHLPPFLFTHLGLPEFPCCLECDIYSRFCYVCGLVMICNIRMTGGY